MSTVKSILHRFGVDIVPYRPPTSTFPPDFDQAINNGLEAAGTGSFRANIGVREGRIAALTHAPLGASEVIDASGAIVRCESHVEMPIEGDIVRGTETFTSPGWDHPEVSHGALRFVDLASLSTFLSDAGLAIEEQFGDWTGAPLTAASPEIITIARKG